MLDQSMIDALLGNLQADKPAEDVKNADVIPFPQQGQTDLSTEEAHAEEVAEAGYHRYNDEYGCRTSTDNASGRQSKPDTVARGDCGVICIYAVKNRE